MTQPRLRDTYILDMPLPVAAMAFLSACALVFVVLKSLISIRVVMATFGMEPTAHVLDWAIVDRHAYAGRAGPKRGDVVAIEVFPKFFVVNRVLGMPGDMIRTVDGRFELNGKVLPRSCRPVSLPAEPAGPEVTALGLPADLSPDILCAERWPDVRSEIRTMDWSVGRPDQSSRQKLLRSGSYYAVGDNRTTMTENYLVLRHGQAGDILSGDETVRREDILGKVIFFVPFTKLALCTSAVRRSDQTEPNPICELLWVSEEQKRN